MALIPRSDVRPFFTLVTVSVEKKGCTSGSDGDRLRIGVTETTTSRSRSRLKSSALGVRAAPYSTQRPRQLLPEERDAIRSLAPTKSLRSLAADFRVSHETIRSVLKR